MEVLEPRQDRKVAALREAFRVLQVRLLDLHAAFLYIPVESRLGF
jgi:hypothetical protein